ncbi:arsenic transporter [Microbacterium aquimaris]|uniref:Arsenic transporter n=1 Tax=Microbacterium aquimaris TaxID=459816 RepID=A0ABU5N2V3_9MICO|nr:arsenic transporter [Microbacterium aquimaris]MDZ8160393.1 arsenic transporter [Microbacterium aquimaris]
MILTFVAALIFVATLVVVIWQPKGFPIGYTALIGALLALVTTVVAVSDVFTVVDIVWNATLTFVAIVLISLILDEAGFFEWAALHVARWGRGNGRLLFVLIVGLGAAVAAVFANDGAALILTPIVVGMLRALKIDAKAALGFILATGFIADTGSLPLVVSNLVNIVSADYFDIGFAEYAVVMVPVGIVAVLASLGVLYLYFRRSIPQTYDLSALDTPATAVRDRVTFRAGWIVLGVLLVGYFVADPLGIPLALVAGLGAVAMVLIAARRPRFAFARVGARAAVVGGPEDVRGQQRSVAEPVIPVARTIREAPWQIVLFSIGMYLVVYGLRNQGLTDYLSEVFDYFGGHGVVATALGVGFVIAILASIMNNMPTVLIAALAITGASATGLTQEVMIYANVIGSDIGPKITPIGSLATLLWLHVLDRKGIHIGWGRYFRTGIVLTLPVLLVTLLALAGWLSLIR